MKLILKVILLDSGALKLSLPFASEAFSYLFTIFVVSLVVSSKDFIWFFSITNFLKSSSTDSWYDIWTISYWWHKSCKCTIFILSSSPYTLESITSSFCCFLLNNLLKDVCINPLMNKEQIFPFFLCLRQRVLMRLGSIFC